jgi:predicted AlkP superfamily phosphohydrolase/phosphomutase
MSKAEEADEAKASCRKVLVLGIDGATFDIIHPLAEEGRLPNLARLIDEGAWGVLDSTLPPVTIPAWVSMMTGKNPGRLGLFDLLRREGYGVEPNGYCFANHAPIWKILNSYSVRTGVMNVPGTYPPEEVDGFMVTGMMTPSKESGFSYPSKLQVDLGESGLDYEIDVPSWQYFDEGVFVKDAIKVTEKRGRAAEYLMAHIPCDFNMVVFTSPDRIHHMIWDKRETVESYWEELDRVLGGLLKTVGEETTVFVVSDHGFGPLERTFFVNEWLRRNGFLRAKREINERAIVKLGRIVERLYRFLGERELLKPVAAFISKVVGLERLQKYAYEYLSNARLEGRVNWNKTQAFSAVHTPHFGQIYINVEGEMQEGCVAEDEKERLVSTLLEKLRELKDPKTGAYVNVNVFNSRDVYTGPHLEEAPEIVFMVDGGRCEIDAKVGEERLFVEGAPLTGWKGTHTSDGVFIAWGPGIRQGFRVEKASILDIAPTLLHSFGVPVQDEMDGRVLDEIYSDDSMFSDRTTVKPLLEGESGVSSFNDGEKALIEERLRKLGYIS